MFCALDILKYLPKAQVEQPWKWIECRQLSQHGSAGQATLPDTFVPQTDLSVGVLAVLLYTGLGPMPGKPRNSAGWFWCYFTYLALRARDLCHSAASRSLCSNTLKLLCNIALFGFKRCSVWQVEVNILTKYQQQSNSSQMGAKIRCPKILVMSLS